MNNVRCVNCGFLNFASAPSCKRCKAEFESAPAYLGNPPSSDDGASSQVSYQAAPYPAEVTQAVPYHAAPQWPQPEYQPPFQPPLYFPTPIAPLPRASKNGATNAVLWTLLGVAVFIALSIGAIWKFGKPASSANYVWQEYKAPDESYTILMPNHPVEIVQSQSTPAGEIQTHISGVEMGQNGAYMVAYADYPGNFTKLSSQELLDAGAQGAVTRSRATLVSKKNITLDGYPGVELELLPPAGEGLDGGHARARIYWAAPRLYIMFTGISKSVDETTMAKFLDSFKLRKKQV
jgi:hypothetical protein